MNKTQNELIKPSPVGGWFIFGITDFTDYRILKDGPTNILCFNKKLKT
jgi:hypothetical protein